MFRCHLCYQDTASQLDGSEVVAAVTTYSAILRNAMECIQVEVRRQFGGT
jgi:hypothetical protein